MKKPWFDHCKRGTASKQPPRSLLRTARRKKKAQRPTHAYSKALECAAQARARKHGVQLGARLLGERNYSAALSLGNPLEWRACARWVAGRSIWARQRAPRQWTWLENVQKVLQFIWISRAFDSRHRGNISHFSSWANSFCIEYKSQERNSLGSDIIYF